MPHSSLPNQRTWLGKDKWKLPQHSAVNVLHLQHDCRWRQWTRSKGRQPGQGWAIPQRGWDPSRCGAYTDTDRFTPRNVKTHPTISSMNKPLERVQALARLPTRGKVHLRGRWWDRHPRNKPQGSQVPNSPRRRATGANGSGECYGEGCEVTCVCAELIQTPYTFT